MLHLDLLEITKTRQADLLARARRERLVARRRKTAAGPRSPGRQREACTVAPATCNVECAATA